MNTTPTDRQQEWIKCIYRLTKKQGRGPTIRELVEGMDVTQKAVQDALDSLEKKGLIERPQVIIKGPPMVTRKGREWL